MKSVLLAVNGTLMRGLELEKNMQDAKATFVREDRTERSYRLYSMDDKNPAMVRVSKDDAGAVSVALEIWEVPYEGLTQILLGEPQGLSIGKVKLINGESVLGVIGEAESVKDKKEISGYGGWREYIKEIKKDT